MKLYCETCEGVGRLYNENVVCRVCGGYGYVESNLIDELKSIKEYCESIDECDRCEIQKECGNIRFKQEVPAKWNLGEDE